MNSQWFGGLKPALQWVLVTAMFLIAMFVASAAQAHQQGSSYSQWQTSDGVPVAVTVRVSALDLTRVGIHPGGQSGAETIRYLQRHLTATGCEPKAASIITAAEGWYSVSWPWQCNSSAPNITSTLFAAVAPNHLHFARWQRADSVVQDSLLHRSRRSVSLAAEAQPVSTSLAAYVKLGVEHILSGYDHLAFLLGLLLLATRRQIVWLVTGFTLGHSVTLALASSGWLMPNSDYIEATIAWSIALLCAEILWRRWQQFWPWLLPLLLLLVAFGRMPLLLLLGLVVFTLAYARALSVSEGLTQQRLTAAVTVAFGLIHGCGFAGVLSELGSIDLTALLGFNLGIELGQLALIIAVLPMAWLLQRWIVPLRAAATHLLVSLAAYWWLLRL